MRSMLPTALAQKVTSASVGKQGERREVTVLFLDVANFTSITSLLNGEDVYEFIDEAMSLLVEVIHRYDGTIDKFTGDGLMALFGAPAAHEDDPERAIRAALEMLTVLQPLQKRFKDTYQVDFQTRIGINTGPAVAGKLGSSLHMEYTVIGDAVNLAARLETAARPNSILVGSQTYQRTAPIFDFETLPPFKVKGITEAVIAYRPLGVRDKPGPLRGLPGLQVPMIGRAEEVDRLHQAFNEVRTGNLSRIGLITGEAGVGKSKLVAEFRRTLDQSNINIFQAGCQAYTGNTPLWVVAEFLRKVIGLSETAAKEEQLEVLRQYLCERGLRPTDTALYLSHLLGLGPTSPEARQRLEALDATMLQKQTHSVLRQVMLAEARRLPTVFIFEDLHWIDPASRDFLDYLIQTTAAEPIMLVLVSRQAELPEIIPFLARVAEQSPARLVDLPLSVLTKTEGLQLIGHLIAQSTPETQALKQHIIKRAEGNPFFIEEIVRMLIDQGGVIRVGDGWQFTSTAPKLIEAVPGTVKGLILARFDRLPASLRQTLQYASVIGNAFPVALLLSLEEINPEAMPVHFRELVQRQFLVARPYRSEAGYVFRHTLMQETIYSTLLKQDRRQIHTEIAEVIEKLIKGQPDEQAETLAYHYGKSNTPDKAIPYLITAADTAARRGAYETAAKHYHRVISLLPATPVSESQRFFQVRIGLGTALKYIGKFTEASQVLTEALAYLWESSVSEDSNLLWPTLVESLRQLADVRQREGQYEVAVSYLEAGLQVLGEDGPQEQPNLWRVLLDRMAWIRYRQGQLDEALHLARAAVDSAEADQMADPIIAAGLYNTLGNIVWNVGDLDRAIMFVEKSLFLYENINYTLGIAVAQGNLGIFYDLQGYWPEAIEHYQQAYDLHQITGDLQNQANNLDNLGTLYMCQGNHEQSRQELEAALAIRQSLGDVWGIAQSHVNLAALALTQKKWNEVTHLAETGLGLAESIGCLEIQIEARWLLAIAQAEKQDVQTGLKLGRQALEMAQANQLLEKEMECLYALGIIFSHLGNYSEAERLLSRSIDLAQAQNNPYRRGLALLQQARVLYGSQKNLEQPNAETADNSAVTAVVKAVEIFQFLGAAYDLGQAQTLLCQIQNGS